MQINKMEKGEVRGSRNVKGEVTKDNTEIQRINKIL